MTDIIPLSAVGSFRDDLTPGTFVIVDQFIDRTFASDKSFFGTGLVAHVSIAPPVNCPVHTYEAADQESHDNLEWRVYQITDTGQTQ